MVTKALFLRSVTTVTTGLLAEFKDSYAGGDRRASDRPSLLFISGDDRDRAARGLFVVPKRYFKVSS